MANRKITLRSEVVERLEEMATQRGESVDMVLSELIGVPSTDVEEAEQESWAVDLAEEMAAADIDWVDDPQASVNSRRHFYEYLEQRAKRRTETDDGKD